MKPEARFVSLVNSKLGKPVHHQSMAFTMANGTPDQYYDLDRRFLRTLTFDNPRALMTRDLWAEYKWLDAPPQRLFVPKLTDLQAVWLDRRWDNDHNAVVIVGFPTAIGSRHRSAMVFYTPSEWANGLSPQQRLPISVQSLADEITQYVCTPAARS